MGCPTEEDLPKLVGHFARTMREDHHAVWVKVVDRQAGGGGVIAAAALWKIYPGIAGAPTSGDELPPAWLEGETREESGKLLDEMNGARRRANPGGFVRESSFFLFFFPSVFSGMGLAERLEWFLYKQHTG